MTAGGQRLDDAGEGAHVIPLLEDNEDAHREAAGGSKESRPDRYYNPRVHLRPWRARHQRAASLNVSRPTRLEAGGRPLLVIAIAVGTLAAVIRLLTTAGFSNDHFFYLSRATQVLSGASASRDSSIRDFRWPGRCRRRRSSSAAGPCFRRRCWWPWHSAPAPG